MSAIPHRSPYVGLVPYAEEDWELFFGRETETELIIANLLASRLTLLFGASGVGKSSVLRAGVAHRLGEQARRAAATSGVPEVAVAVFSTWRDDPLGGMLAAVRAAVARAVGHEPAPVPAPAPLADTLAAWADLVGGELLVILDQFEEYFLYHGREDGDGTFALEFPRLVNRAGLRANFLIGIREDAVARLDRFKGRIPNVFDNYLRLHHLSHEAAEEAVRKPLAAFNARHPDETVAIEDALVQAVLRQTRAGEVRPAGGAGETEPSDAAVARIETPYLQMVMMRLWDEEQARGSRTLRLATFVDDPPGGLGGANQIVRTHLDAEMNRLEPGERDVAAQALRYLVTRTGTKIALAVEDLAGYTSLPADALAPVLEKLAAGGRRILRPVPVPERPDLTRYELFHDVLAPAIGDWRRRHEAVREQEAIRQREDERRREELRAAEVRRERERSRYLKAGIVVVSTLLLLALSMAWVARRQGIEAERATRQAQEESEQRRLALARAEFALAQARNADTAAEASAKAAIEARAVQATRAEPRRATAGEELREAFLNGTTQALEGTARRLRLLNEQVRFRGRAEPQHYRIEQGQVYQYSMQPVAESVPGGLGTLAAVTFKMNHPTFRNRVLAGDPDRGFRAGYIGWGCLETVPVLLEYKDPGRAPEVALFAMCDNTETVSRSPAPRS